jgi:hypothetical protein
MDTKEFEIIRALGRRTYSELDIIRYRGETLVWKRMKPNGPNGEVSQALLQRSFANYTSLRNKTGLVQIREGWWDGMAFNTVMEYLDGWERLSNLKPSPKAREELFIDACRILASLLDQGFTDYDPDPTNFMVNPATGEVKMIDLDKIMQVEEVCKDCSHYGSWFATRMVRMLLWLADAFVPQLQYTKVVKR